MYPSNFRNFRLLVRATTSWLSTNQPKINKMAAKDGQLNLTICDVRRFFSVNTGKGLKLFEAGG